MKEGDKKEPQTQPTSNNTQPATPSSTTENNQEAAQPEQDENNGDYVVMGSGLGIDE